VAVPREWSPLVGPADADVVESAGAARDEFSELVDTVGVGGCKD